MKTAYHEGTPLRSGRHTSLALRAVAFAAFATGCGANIDGGEVEGVSEQGDEVIWNNDLFDYYQLSTEEKFYANSSAAFMRSSDIVDCTATFCKVRTVNGRMCAGERYADQAAIAAGGTAFLVGPRHLATAGHNLTEVDCADAKIVFRWRKDSAGTPANANILHEHIYSCTKVVADGRPEGQDWAVIEVDRDVTTSAATPRGPLALARGPVALNTLFEVPQHFAMLPMKWSMARVEHLPSAADSYLRAPIDSTGGASGAAWIASSPRLVIGVHARGPIEDRDLPEDTCIEEQDCFINPGAASCSLLTDKPAATPAWWVAKGPGTFKTLATWAKPAGVPLAGDFDGDGKADIIWFGSGATADVAWWGDGTGSFVTTPLSLSTTNVPTVGDYDGDGKSDIFWYGTGAATDSVWWGKSDRSFASTNVTVSGSGLKPVSGDFDRDGKDDVFWYGPGATADAVWYGNGAARTFTSVAQTVAGSSYTPFSGDFDGDGVDDVFWFGPGATSDSVWWGKSSRTFTNTTVTASLSGVTPIVGDFDGDSQSDVLWQVPNAVSSTLWSGRATRKFGSSTVSHTAAAAGQARDYNNDDLDDLVLPGADLVVQRGKTWGG